MGILGSDRAREPLVRKPRNHRFLTLGKPGITAFSPSGSLEAGLVNLTEACLVSVTEAGLVSVTEAGLVSVTVVQEQVLVYPGWYR